MKHTLGPWTFNDAGHPLMSLFGGDSYGLWHSNRTEDELIANARLIAAAPELLEALKAFVEIPDVQNEDEWPETARAKAVIAKAEGR